MPIAPNAPITFGDVINHAYELLKSSVNNLDNYSGALSWDGAFNARTEAVEASLNAAWGRVEIYFTGKPGLVSSWDFQNQWNDFINANGFGSKLNQPITLKGLVHFLTCMANYVNARFTVVTNPRSGNKAKAYMANGIPDIPQTSEFTPITSNDIYTMLNAMKQAFDNYNIAPCQVSWSQMAIACSSCSSSSCSSSSSSSCSCSSSSSSSSSSSCSYIIWYNLG